MSGMFSIRHDTARLEHMLRSFTDKKVNQIRRRVQGRVARNMAKAQQFAAPVRTGATKKAIGAKEKKNYNFFIGVRKDYKTTVRVETQQHKLSKRGKALKGYVKERVEKWPHKYAWLVNRYAKRSGGWFDKVWDIRKGEMSREYIAGMYDEVKTEFNKRG